MDDFTIADNLAPYVTKVAIEAADIGGQLKTFAFSDSAHAGRFRRLFTSYDSHIEVIDSNGILFERVGAQLQWLARLDPREFFKGRTVPEFIGLAGPAHETISELDQLARYRVSYGNRTSRRLDLTRKLHKFTVPVPASPAFSEEFQSPDALINHYCQALSNLREAGFGRR